MKATQYTLAYKINDEYQTVLSNCDIIKFENCKLYNNKKAAEKALVKLMEILPIRVKNLKEAGPKWKDTYLRDNEMLVNGVKVVEVILEMEEI